MTVSDSVTPPPTCQALPTWSVLARKDRQRPRGRRSAFHVIPCASDDETAIAAVGDFEQPWASRSRCRLEAWAGDTCEGQKAICAVGEDWVDTFEDFAAEAEQILDLGNCVIFAGGRQDARPARSIGRLRVRKTRVLRRLKTRRVRDRTVGCRRPSPVLLIEDGARAPRLS